MLGSGRPCSLSHSPREAGMLSVLVGLELRQLHCPEQDWVGPPVPPLSPTPAGRR
jgi:hypothetical protein